MVQSYWDKVSARRFSRRRSLALASGTGAAALLLAACGGSDTGEEGSGGVVAEPRDTSSEARRGGNLVTSHNADIQTFDPHTMSIPSANLTHMAYSRLFRPEVGHLEQPLFGSIQPDAIEGYELSADKLQLTVKVRPNLKWHNLPPVNGRNVDAQDLAYSYNRMASVATQRAFYVGSLGGPIDSVTATDDRTVVFKLNQVYAPLLSIFSTVANGNYYLVPRESENQNALDLRRTQLGSGPWMLKEYNPSVGFKYARHDGWYDAGRVYLDEVQLPIISEYAAGLAQFKAGSLYRAGPPTPSFGITNEDILSTKQENSNLNMHLLGVNSSSGFGWFGWNPELATPFRDKRLRQALSMSWDRDIWLDTFLGTDKLQAAGLPVERLWNTACNVAWTGWWLDPKSSKFGPNAKYYEHNIAEAKKLVAAAGHPNGLDVDMYHITSSEYGFDFPRQVETYASFASEVGLRLQSRPMNFSTDWRPLSDSRGDHAGIAFRGAGGNVAPDVPESLVRMMHPVHGGVTYTGFFSEGSSFQKGDTEITALLERTRTEFDQEKRIAIVEDIQRLVADRQYFLRVPGGTNQISLSWPAVENENVFREDLRFVGQWLNPSKAPLA